MQEITELSMGHLDTRWRRTWFGVLDSSSFETGHPEIFSEK